MRIRTIKPEFWRSDDVASLTIEDRLLFIGLWSYVDDSGIGVDKIAHICADLFAPDLEENPPEVFARVTGGLRRLAERGLIIRYEADGKPFLYVTNWKKHQRIDKPSKQRYPLPDLEEWESSRILPEYSRNTPEEVAPGTGEQGNRGSEEQGNSETSDSDESQEPPRADVQEVIDHMLAALKANDVRKSNVGKSWHDAARLLIDKDGYTVEQIKWVTDWATGHHFWKSNVLSLPKLREKFDQLKLQAMSDANGSGRQSASDIRLQKGMAMIQASLEEDEPDYRHPLEIQA